MNMLIYLIGTVLVVGALAYGASTLGVDTVWIAVGAAIILGFGIMGAVSKTQRKE